MAPPSKRRPGFSRKAQYGLFASYVIAVVGALVGLLLVVTAWIDPRGHNAIRATIADITSPISSGLRAVVRGAGSAGTTVSDYFDAASKNAEMRRERDAARRALIKARAAQYENGRLKRLLGIAGTEGEVVAARLVSSTGTSSRRYAILNAGSSHGVRHGQPVRGPDGLIGTVVETGLVSARVLLITDSGNVVPVRRLSDGLTAIATGLGDGTLDIRGLNVGSNIFRPGDLLVTSGAGGVYPPQIPVAVVIRITGDNAVARPLADPAGFDFAVVQPVYQPAAAPSALPAAEDEEAPAE